MDVGRNEPCPCGSGLKYKRCCLSDEEQAGQKPVPANAFIGIPAFAHAGGPSRAEGTQFAREAVSPRSVLSAHATEADHPDLPPADTVPLLPVEVALKYTYPEPYGTADVSYIFPGGKTFVTDKGLPVSVDDIRPGARIRCKGGLLATVTSVDYSYEPPGPPVQLANGMVLSRVIGTIKHHWNTVMDVTWLGYTATGTPSHSYYSVDRQAYVPAADLRSGELLRTDADAVTPVMSVSAPRHGLFEVFNIKVEHFHNYFVGTGRGQSVLVHNGGCIETPLEAEVAENLPESVLLRVVRGDAKNRPFGTPRNPRTPTMAEFNPRIGEVAAGDLPDLVVGRKHGIFPERAESIAQLSNEELVQFRPEDPMSAVRTGDGLSLTGGHHRINEIIQRVESGRMDANTTIRILVHD